MKADAVLQAREAGMRIKELEKELKKMKKLDNLFNSDRKVPCKSASEEYVPEYTNTTQQEKTTSNCRSDFGQYIPKNFRMQYQPRTSYYGYYN